MHFGAMDLNDALEEYIQLKKAETGSQQLSLGKREFLGIGMAISLLVVIAATSSMPGVDRPTTAKKLLMSSSR